MLTKPFLILKGEFHDLKVGDWGLKWEIFCAMDLTVETFTIEWNLDNYAGDNTFNIYRKSIKTRLILRMFSI